MATTNSEMVLNYLKQNYGKEFSKQEIAKAVSNQFNVTVEDVRVVIRKGKKTRFSRGKHAYPGTTYRRDHKFAYVTLKEGDKIAVFKEVEEASNNKAAKKDDKKSEKKAEKSDKPAREDKPKSDNVRSREAEKRRKERQRKITALEKQLEELETQMADCPAEDYVRLGDLFNQKEAVEEELLLLYEEEEG